MPSTISGYNYDIFISYRQKDNKGDRWVSEFVNALKDELESTFKEEISIYFDINPHDGLLETHDVDESLKEKLKCLVFIPIISRTYCDPKSFAWEHEFKVFVEQASQDQYGLKVRLPNGNVANRVLPVHIYDLDMEDIKLCESILSSVLRGIEFIYKEPGVNRPLKPDDNEKLNLNKTKYRNQINKVANAIKELINGIIHYEKIPDKGVKEKFKERQVLLKKNRSKIITGLILIVLDVLFLKSQSPTFRNVQQDDIETSLEKTVLIIERLPLEGWELDNDIEKYKPINLYDKINGRAEYYLSYDLAWAIFGNFRDIEDNRNSIELSIFNMITPTHAFGVFSGERTAQASQLEFGRESYFSKADYYIWEGQYYIHIAASESTDELQMDCLDLAQKITDALGDSDEPVWGLEALPKDNLVPYSVQYFLVDALGYIFLEDTYTAKYYNDNIEIPVFLSRKSSAESVKTIITRFSDHFNKYGKGIEHVSVEGIEVLVCNMNKYYDVIFQKGILVAGVTGIKDKDLAIKASIDFWRKLRIDEK